MSTRLMSSPPSTPSRPTRVYQYGSLGHQPLNSSPLASSEGSSPASSPGVPSYARRRAQYKSVESHSVSSPSASRRQSQRRRVTLGGDLFQPMPPTASASTPTVPTEEAPRKAFLRERFRARCLERAQKDRERKIQGRRNAISEASSEGEDEMMEDDEDEEEMINDELFHRLVASGKRKEQHAYRLSYQVDVGSSFDPVLEETAEWEHETVDPQHSSNPYDLEEEELAAYAAEYDLHLEDLNPDEFFTHSDLDDYPFPEEDMTEAAPRLNGARDGPAGHAQDGDIEMVM
ncbi:uncharacterized protein C8Q71DRAFT_908407 [Rhodofomes roseus]|uniref:Transcription factor Iwr1 domain-containing protein n=1 Tax=Rhodofomes roseus TaxID=34475 RepID=A0A4Y9YCM4_9APHY|nr:uncharacterized protein C8Q71DRAFT_908407 [Rhodofomes roseus]KAH9835239.1 hypothetical protein C8Q71DRAFT_908407 [Rhodofomes roseus]TFY59327.1 hypothetical protein EVJ58_g5840 [Rhodofomes roseus]